MKADRESKIETLMSVKAWCRWTVTSDTRQQGSTGSQRPFQEVDGVGRKKPLWVDLGSFDEGSNI